MSRKRIAGLVTTALIGALLSMAVVATPALADSYQRQRSGPIRWSPTDMTVKASYYNGTFNMLEWQFKWMNILNRNEIDGSHRAVKFKARTDIGYADQYGTYFSSNAPSAARAVKDTQQSDTSCCTFGVVFADANYFSLNTTYWAKVDVRKTYLTTNAHEIEWDVLASSRLDHSTACSPSDAFCTFSDYVSTLVRGRGFVVTQSQTYGETFVTNKLANHDFAGGTATGWANTAGNQKAVYCGGQGFGSQDPCFMQFNRGTNSAASVYQDKSVRTYPGDQFTGEAMLRCPVTNAYDCQVRLSIWGLGLTANQQKYVSATLPRDGRWYHCKVDEEHGFGSGFTGDHNVLRFEVYNLTGGSPPQNLDLDFTSRSLFYDRITGTTGDPSSPPASGGNCFLASQYN